MEGRVSLGPVFAYEWLTTARKWQVYAARAAFIGILLCAMVLIWWGDVAGKRLSTRGQARVGEAFAEAMIGTQLAMVILVAPAATAGAICLDKARGTLAHLMLTDLSDTEIVLGKLAARLVPVVGAVCCVWPVIALASLLGGIDPVLLTGAFLVTLGIAVFGCALALLISVWATRVHEALLGTYAILGVWLLFIPMLEGILYQVWGASLPRGFVQCIDPFSNAFDPQGYVEGWSLAYQAVYASALCGVSLILTVLAVWRLRAVAVRQSGRGEGATRARRSWLRILPALPGPELDPNPILWREWHRRRPSRWMRTIMGGFVVLVSGFSVLAILTAKLGPGGEFAALVNAFSFSIGMLFLAILAPTALSEERMRGSLDVLMSTPLPTSAIIWGKWWGVLRLAPLLAFWPTIVCSGLLLRDPARILERPFIVAVPLLTAALILAQTAALAAFGLAVATWVKRLGRALAITVIALVAATLGLPLLVSVLFSRGNDGIAWMMVSPFWGIGLLTVALESGNSTPDNISLVIGALGWIAIYGIATAGLLFATLRTFDRCLGRVPDDESRPRPESVPPPISKPALQS